MAEISVIIPTYNRASVLSRALDSVLKQSFNDFELIIVDDGSNDGSGDILNDYQSRDARIKIIFQKNHGVSHARNRGIELACGKWIALLDSDDEWLEDKLERQMAFSNMKPEINLIHGEEIWIRNGKRVNPMNKHKKYGGYIFEQCLPLCIISPSAAMIKKETLLEMNGFDEDFPVCEDYDLWLKITSKYPVGFLNEPLIIKYGGHEDQLSRKFVAMDFWRVRALDRMGDFAGLTVTARSKLESEIKRKAVILKQGYLKHQNLEYLPYIESILEKYS